MSTNPQLGPKRYKANPKFPRTSVFLTMQTALCRQKIQQNTVRLSTLISNLDAWSTSLSCNVALTADFLEMIPWKLLRFWTFWMKVRLTGNTSSVSATIWSSVIKHYSDVIMGVMVSQITGVTIVYLIVCSGEDQRKHQSSASLVFVRGIHRWPVSSPHKWPVTRKMFPFDAFIMKILTKSVSGGVTSTLPADYLISK